MSKKKSQNKWKKFLTKASMGLFGLTVALAAGGTANAGVEKVDPDYCNFDFVNSTVIQYMPEITNFTTDVTFDFGMEDKVDTQKHIVGRDAPKGALSIQGWFDDRSSNNYTNSFYYSTDPGGYALHSYRFVGAPSDLQQIRIESKHGNAGYYSYRDGTRVPVDVKFTYHSMHFCQVGGTAESLILSQDRNLPAGKQAIYFTISENPSYGVVFWNISDYKVTYEVYNHDTGQKMEMKDGFLTFNSLNHNTKKLNGQTLDISEGVKYDDIGTQNPGSLTNAYVTTDTNVAFGPVSNVAGKDLGDFFRGTSNKFTDYIGGETFSRNSVSFQLTGDQSTFTVVSGGGEMWTTYSSGRLSTNDPHPEGFHKAVKDGEGNDINKQQVQVGDEIYYEFTSGVAEMNSEIIQKYSHYAIVDPLPKEVEFIRGEFWKCNEKGEPIEDITTKAGEFEYDKESHEAKFVVNKGFLQNGFQYLYGETYKTRFFVKVKKDVKDETVFDDVGYLQINKAEFPSNKVTNNLPNRNKIKKTIVTKDGKHETDLNELEKGERDVRFRYYIDVTNAEKLSELTFIDELEAPFEFKDAKFIFKEKDVSEDWIKSEKSPDKQYIEYNLKAEKVKDYIDQSFVVELNVKMREDYDYSVYPENKIPNIAKIRTNFDTEDSNKVEVVTYPDELTIKKAVVNHLGEKVDLAQLQDNTAPIEFQHSFLVPNRPSKDYVVNEVIFEDKFDAAFEFKNKETEFIITDSKTGEDVTKKATIETRDEGQTVVATFKDKFAASMKGKWFNVKTIVYYRQDTDLSKYEDNRIPNKSHITVKSKDGTAEEETEEEDSNKVEVVPNTKETTVVKGILNNKGEIVDHWKLTDRNQTITFTGHFQIPNDKDLQEIAFVDTLNDALEYQGIRVYESDKKEVSVFDSKNDMDNKAKGILDLNGQVVKFNLAKDNIQQYAGKRMYVELDTKIKANVDLDTIKDGVIKNIWELIVNNEKTPSPEVEIEVPQKPIAVTKKVLDGENELEAKDIPYNTTDLIPYRVHVKINGTAEFKKLRIEDALDKRLATTNEQFQQAKIQKNKQDVTKDFTLKYVKADHKVIATLNENADPEAYKGVELQLDFNVTLAEGLKLDKDAVIPNVANVILDEKDPEPSNPVTVTPKEEMEQNTAKKFIIDPHNDGKLLETYTLQDGESEISFLIENNINSAVSNQITVKDELPKELVYKSGKAYYLDGNGNQVDITSKGKLTGDNGVVLFVLPKEAFDELKINTFYLQIDTKLAEGITGTQSFKNVAILSVDDKEVPTNPVVITPPLTTENMIEKFVVSQEENKSLVKSWEIKDTSKELDFIKKATILNVSKQISILDELPKEVVYKSAYAYILNPDGSEKVVTDQGDLKAEGQKVSFNMTKEAFTALNTKELYVRITTTIANDVKPGTAFQNVATLMVDDKTTPSNKVDLKIPEDKEDKENPENPTNSAVPGEDTGKSLPQTGSKANQPIFWIMGLLAAGVIGFFVYKDMKKKKAQEKTE